MTAPTEESVASRIHYLDGLRGLAILGVMFWHYTDEVYASFLPYATMYSDIPGLDHGWVGVNLFFLISGYVILLTLERCAGFGDFIRRRWLRLFPAMLIASLIIFAASQLNGVNMPHGRADAVDLLPGLTFISVGFYDALLPFHVDELDGVFWTLYVEVGFYLVFGIFYFWLGWARALAALAALWLSVMIGANLASAFNQPALVAAMTPLQWIGAEYFGWFVSGALFLKSRERGSNALFALAMSVGFLSAFTSGLWQPDDLVSQLYLVGVVLFFALAQKWRALQRALTLKALLFAGFVSYPLYLLHNELGVGLIAAFGEATPPVIWPFLPLVMAALMLVLAYVVARYGEPSLKDVLGEMLRAPFQRS